MANLTIQKDYELLQIKKENLFNFSEGLFGFESIKQYIILTHPEEKPFVRLTAVRADLFFFAVVPHFIYPDYAPDINEEDFEKCELSSKRPLEDSLLLSLVTIPNDEVTEARMNLVAPILLNTQKGLGRQVIIKNHQDYPSVYLLYKQI